MIHRFLKIKNVGRLRNVSLGKGSGWDGQLSKINAIYADNGSGKTTFTQILKSINSAEDANTLSSKKSFGVETNMEISYINDLKIQCNYRGTSWNKYDNSYDIFDSYYIEDNVYIITLNKNDEKDSFYEVIVGEEAIKTRKKVEELRSQRKKESVKRSNLKRKLKRTTDSIEIKKINALIIQSKKTSDNITKELGTLDVRGISYSEEFGQKYLDIINNYLLKLGTDLIITKLNKRAHRFVYYIKIGDYDLRSEMNSISLKHTLSEGEKNCLAFSFFLARLDLCGGIENRIIVFDDPISSLDANRRSMSLNILVKLARKSKQFYLLSHDVNFVKDFKNKIDESLVLKIIKTKETSTIVHFDIIKETMSGIFKDITVLQDFVENGESSEYSLRDVVRCIRPVLEGIFRIKYFAIIEDNEWLGDFIKKIRDSKEGEAFYRNKNILSDLEDLNDYSKTYHHSNPNYLEETIVSSELLSYCKLLFKTLELI